jgi:single-strand DNA-binding protein
MNSINLLGRLTKEPELKTSKGGNNFVKFTIAVKRKRSDESDFFNVTAFGKLADTIHSYVKKGHMIGLTGRVEITNKKDGDKWQTFVDVIAEDITFAEKKDRNTDQNEVPEKPADPFAGFEPKQETKKDASFEDMFNFEGFGNME